MDNRARVYGYQLVDAASLTHRRTGQDQGVLSSRCLPVMWSTPWTRESFSEGADVADVPWVRDAVWMPERNHDCTKQCAHDGCTAEHQFDGYNAVRAHSFGWFSQRDGRVWCPDHNPPWVTEWRAKRHP